MGSIGVVGLGAVGGTIFEALKGTHFSVLGYDPYLAVGSPESLADCSLVFLCVPTPPSTGSALDVSAVWKAVRDVEATLPDGAVIAVKSTVPPGTSTTLSADFPRFEFASVPEFLVSTRPMETLRHPDRVVIGARTSEVFRAIAQVMRAIAPGAPLLMLTPLEAELAKLAANAMLAAKVSMANELALVCERYGVEWSNVQCAVGLDRRIGPDHLTVTTERGFGGGCLPKDLDGLIAAARDRGHTATLLSAVAEFNAWVRGDSVGGHAEVGGS